MRDAIERNEIDELVGLTLTFLLRLHTTSCERLTEYAPMLRAIDERMVDVVQGLAREER